VEDQIQNIQMQQVLQPVYIPNFLENSTLANTKEDQKFIHTMFGSAPLKTQLLYRGSRDGLFAQIFHQNCDN